jgi:hypothetical protein
MRKRGWLFLFGLTISSTAPNFWAPVLHAQGPAPLEPGVRIRVTVHTSTSRQRLAGTMVRMNSDSVVLRTDNRQAQAFATADVRKLEVSVRRSRSTWRGALIGTAVGAVVGAGTGATADDGCPAGEPCFRMKYSRTTDVLGSAMFIGAVGGIIGGGVGAVMRHDVWRDSTVLLKR